MPSQKGRTSYAMNGATYRGKVAIGGSIAHRFNTRLPLALTGGFSYGGHKNNVAKAGIAGEF